MVQGVGFRFTVEEIAINLGLTGWVKNLMDGRVELEAEGEEDALSKSLEAINKRMGLYIKGAEMEWLTPTGKFDSFTIAF